MQPRVQQQQRKVQRTSDWWLWRRQLLRCRCPGSQDRRKWCLRASLRTGAVATQHGQALQHRHGGNLNCI